MEVKSYFNDFLSNIRLTENQVKDLKTGHSTLRTRLLEDENISSIIISTFLQGSYRRATAVRPKNNNKSDVDVIVVTNLDPEEYSPQEALDLFIPFLDEHYNGKYKMQGRSIGIELSYVELDLVITSAPSEIQESLLKSESVLITESLEDLNHWNLSKSWSFSTEESKDEPAWKTEPLLIPDREADSWEQTDPLAQIKWTWEKNAACNTHYVNVVKALKWWKKLNPNPKYPKGYPLEHFVGTCCPDGISSVAEGITLTLESIVENYPEKPILKDHGVPEHDVFKRITDEEYQEFYELVSNAATLAREALDCQDKVESIGLWRDLFGSKFPEPPKGVTKNGGFTQRTEATTSVTGGRFG
ncbi:SMODS domain-containing nucleotidyltransferase [Bacillus canaveralius]|uniref:SMODS domain-containing nucleotidyltransferase n=1 Tax=Bacillus canaveralius TaxID=1403243 RepID=UPI000F7AD91F|nr:nucleotidyltransferase [Bacillus canaveralius]RSK45405.1 nucleotidyltransferase [Bacillus canaveralius]